MTEIELKRAKEFLIGSAVLGLEDSSSVAQFYGLRQVLSGEIETLEAVIEKIQQVTIQDVQDVFKLLIKPGEMRLALIGPYKDEAKFEKLIEEF